MSCAVNLGDRGKRLQRSREKRKERERALRVEREKKLKRNANTTKKF
jgi:hypothetical protein